ncbi:hypothetical protein ACM8BJ_24005 [Pseudomonas aeruginosa]|uniref:hypothetical protein n=1 Tax=Pseudomonadaceae TaxID=135621 RepID=UPI001375C4A1|nr:MULTISPECIES: hypothetical protein [Pseudomonadaceae]MBP7824826.1 hypothetical protein [Pseudomonas sp.]NCT81443.1 hypothetical protein [Stutzerimonas stutzeri]MBC7198240.1 hypothetical protein [Stutzerimonas balearica]MBZ3677431.1 hypothetical protein [Pseudomonas aeruginosa]MBZ3688426.1 hypothetical protein [Pseudomonas aeruginosa]
MAKVHYRRSGNRTHCRYSARPSRVKLKMVDLPEFLDVDADLQCSDCLRAAQRDVFLEKIGKGSKTEPIKAKPLTAADCAALAELPASEWFDVAHAPIARPSYRCERLEAAGLLERRVVNAGTTGESLWRKTQYRRRPGIDCV